jgi:hypothetical protein
MILTSWLFLNDALATAMEPKTKIQENDPMLKRLKIVTLALCLLAPGLLMADHWARYDAGQNDCIGHSGGCLVVIVR